jgi:pimeloyl-ACP methyl ester carboxylesterase
MKAVVVAGLVVLAGALVAVAVWLWTPDKTRPELEALYLAHSGDMITVDGTPLHVRDTGPREAPAVILLHGFGASLHTWDPWADVLDDDLRVIRLDLPGAGLSPPDPTGDYSDARVISLLLDLMDHLSLERASLVGNSVGGRLAWTLAAEHPERVNRVV